MRARLENKDVSDAIVVRKPTPRLSAVDIAEICHETNRSYCIVISEYGNFYWRFAPQWQRDSAIAGVHTHLADPNITPEQSHENWMRRKFEDGWKVGPKKSLVEKEHPCMVPYDQLPKEQQVKDILFKAVVDALRPLYDPTLTS